MCGLFGRLTSADDPSRKNRGGHPGRGENAVRGNGRRGAGHSRYRLFRRRRRVLHSGRRGTGQRHSGPGSGADDRSAGADCHTNRAANQHSGALLRPACQVYAASVTAGAAIARAGSANCHAHRHGCANRGRRRFRYAGPCRQRPGSARRLPYARRDTLTPF